MKLSYLVDMETTPDPTLPVPPWMECPTFTDSDGVVHRVIAIRLPGATVHHEFVIDTVPFMACGPSLEKYVDEGLACFGSADAALTCVLCASGCVLDGDRLRQAQKMRTFGMAYGARVHNGLAGLPPSKPLSYVPGKYSHHFVTERITRRFGWLRRALSKALEIE